ncbi:hypothetical protein L2E82_20657 [Cichorium intybus]|uniref:Uncharacterized protein n=1 Tax=Cichorium intybus TaxID=13427 RepID=A0ACB9DUQ6_CICIN|nr:hypothetical protein L2E82_20657 [Cichorium intybus]
MRRLPQVFSKVLELPLRSDADVLIEDRFDSFRFTAKIKNNAFSSQVKAHALKIHPQVTKVVVSGGDDGGEGLERSDKSVDDGWKQCREEGSASGSTAGAEKRTASSWKERGH